MTTYAKSHCISDPNGSQSTTKILATSQPYTYEASNISPKRPSHIAIAYYCDKNDHTVSLTTTDVRHWHKHLKIRSVRPIQLSNPHIPLKNNRRNIRLHTFKVLASATTNELRLQSLIATCIQKKKLHT